jgi:hypothetical protein
MINMKYLLLLLLSTSLYAAPTCKTENSEENAVEQKVLTTDVPSHLNGATIIVRLANGKQTEVPAEQFKVVPRKQQYLVTRTLTTSNTTCSEEAVKLNKNRISVLGGIGAQEGLSKSTNGSTVKVESNTGAVGGVQYQRLITEKISIGVQGQTNQTGSLSIGLDF